MFLSINDKSTSIKVILNKLLLAVSKILTKLNKGLQLITL